MSSKDQNCIVIKLNHYLFLFRQEYYTRKLVDGGAPLKRAGKALK